MTFTFILILTLFKKMPVLEMAGQRYYETYLKAGGTQGTELDLILYTKVFPIILKGGESVGSTVES